MTLPETSHRLPRDTVPRRYRLELRPNLETSRFGGHVMIDLEIVDATSELIFNSLDLELRTVRLLDGRGETLSPTLRHDPDEQQVRLGFDQQLVPGAGYRLEIEFRGIINEDMRGFYRSTFRDEDGREQTVATTQFEATEARRAFPCWDEPDFKATFAVTLVLDRGLTALSNAPQVSERILPDGRVELRFAESMTMSTYLVALVVGPYELPEPLDVDGVPIRVAAVGGKPHLTMFATEAAAHALRFLTRYFGIPYPAAKLDHVAVPEFAAGAMENLGCIIYREGLLLVDPDSAAQTELRRIATVIAHETAHMWFGDLVTMKWWNGLWLNEAFATMMELTTTDALRPEWGVWAAFVAGRSLALSIDALRSTRPVEYPVGRPEEAEAMFDVLTYQKGGSVLRMLEQFIGPEAFRKGISHYLATHAYGNAETSDLWSAIEAATGEPVGAIMDQWVTQPGYPVISVDLADDASTLVLAQHRFQYDPIRPDPAAVSDVWAVPVNLRASVNGEIFYEKLLLDQPRGSVSFPGPIDWVVVNDGAWGFYRTRYSRRLWERISGADPMAVLAPLERLQLLEDVWADVLAGGAQLREWTEVAAALAGEPDPDVWATLAGALGFLHLVDADEDGERAAALASFVGRLAGPAWARLGWDPVAGEDGRDAVARGRLASVLAELGGDEEVTLVARQRLNAHLSGRPALAPDLVGPAARAAVLTGGEDMWQLVRGAFHQADSVQDKLRYLAALALTPLPRLIAETLDMSLGAEVPSQDAHILIATALGRRRPGEAWNWLLHHWNDVVARMPSPLLLQQILEPAASFVDEALAASVHEFASTLAEHLPGPWLDQILERMDLSVVAATRLREELVPSLSAR